MLNPMRFGRRAWLKYLACACLVTVLLSYCATYRRALPSLSRLPLTGPGGHPITKLIADAQGSFAALLDKRSSSLEEAAQRYRERRGRHPPPGFDAWFAAAQKHDAIVVEDFFDRIYHDLAPFWALDPLELRRQAHQQPQLIRVRGGKATFETDNPHRPEFIQLWHGLVKEIPGLPDLDMVVNVMDETRILVPWEKINTYVKKEQAERHFVSADDAISEYTGYTELDAKPEPYDPGWIHGELNKYWDHLRAACPPGSPSRDVPSLPTFNSSIDDLYPKKPVAAYTYKGFVSNFTASRDACLQPHLRGMHGTFIESISMSTLHDLFPMFGGYKLEQNNEIVIPAGMYLTDREFYSGGKGIGGAWSKKKDALVWRGVASGGRNKADSWWHFHRHRWAQMMNGTTLSRVLAGEKEAGPTFNVPSADIYDLAVQKKGELGRWVGEFADVGFNHLECFPFEEVPGGGHVPTCPYTDPFFGLAQTVPMQEQYNYKYLPDVDGNSYSARWRGFLRSTSCPLKSTIYAEWHDDRLVPWVHFVPFDSSYMDIYAIMDYFLHGHDDKAQKIAEDSSTWAAKVMRREDMMLYTWRLLLEYARVVDPRRYKLAFVQDLKR